MVGKDALQTWITRFTPSSLHGVLKLDVESIDGFQGTLSWKPQEPQDNLKWQVGGFEDNGQECTYILTNDKVVATCNLKAFPENNAIVVHTKLKGIADTPMSWNALQPVRMIWNTNTDISVRYIDGGSTQAFYPPRAYTENIIKGKFTRDFDKTFEIRSGDDGRSSNGTLPIMQSFIDRGGIVASMEWSGLWKQGVRRDSQSGNHFHEVSIPVNNLVLEKDEELQLPPVHLVFYEGDRDIGSNAFRKYVFDQICPDLGDKKPLPPISYDHWFGVLNNINEPFLRKQADRCAELGLEYFVIDAGWFPVGFHEGVGNWNRVDLEKFPNGLEPIAEYVRSKGMKLGLWFEVERASKTSDAYLEHPEWFISVDDPTNGRLNDFAHLDLSLKPAQDWVIETIGYWIEKLDLKWSRMDYNIGPLPFWQKVDPTGKRMFHYIEGLYRVLDELRSKYPEWLIEGCASGGRRFDLGTIRRAHTYWFSDHTVNPHICRYMQSGANRFLPGHLANSAVTVTSIGAGDNGMTDVDVFSRMIGALAFNGDIASWSSEWTRRCKELVDWYREWRWLVDEDFYALTQPPRNVNEPEIVQFVSRDQRTSLIFGFVAEDSASTLSMPKGLNREWTYELSDPFGNSIEYGNGAQLMDRGLEANMSDKQVFIRKLVAK